MDDPNNRQVGGTHYAGAYQHWDFVMDANLGYLDGNATKYVSRWRKKAGRQDLEKGLHYVEKCVERGVAPALVKAYDALERFCVENKVPGQDKAVLAFIVHGDFENAAWMLKVMIDELAVAQ